MRLGLSLVVATTVGSCSKAQPQPEPPGPPAPAAPVASAGSPEPVVAPVETKPYALPADYLRFDAACEPGERIVVAAVGDVLMHRELQRHAHRQEARWTAIWGAVADLLAAADLTYANLEGPLAPGLDRDFNEVPDPGPSYDGLVYRGYPRFNYHPSLAVDLRKSGVDIVSTANNHALDRGPVGVDRTIESLRKAKLKFTGTRHSEANPSRLHVTTQIEGIKLAWIACTATTNGIADELGQVTLCGRDERKITKAIERLAHSDRIDGVIVTPHWGKQYESEPRQKEIDRAHRFLEAGAIAVLGGHPHVLQPWERYQTSDGRETFVIYSLGNFASHQPELPRRSSAIVYLGITKTEDGRTFVNGVRHLPTHVRQVGDGRNAEFYVEAVDRVTDLDLSESRASTTSILGPSNVVDPQEVVGSLSTTPHCDPSWRAP